MSIIEACQYIHGSANVDTGPSATPLVLWHLVLYGLSTGPRDKGLRTGSAEGDVDGSLHGTPQANAHHLCPSYYSP